MARSASHQHNGSFSFVVQEVNVFLYLLTGYPTPNAVSLPLNGIMLNNSCIASGEENESSVTLMKSQRFDGE
jgi:hypothetical protein